MVEDTFADVEVLVRLSGCVLMGVFAELAFDFLVLGSGFLECETGSVAILDDAGVDWDLEVSGSLNMFPKLSLRFLRGGSTCVGDGVFEGLVNVTLRFPAVPDGPDVGSGAGGVPSVDEL